MAPTGHAVPLPTPLYLLAGGRSSRFGTDKARALLHDRPLIGRVATALGPAAHPVIVVADRPGKYKDLGFQTIADATPHLGPLGGLVTALADRTERHGPGWLLLASCDLASPDSSWVETLAAAATGDCLCVLYRGERLEPLLALYHTNLLPLARSHVERGVLALWRLVEAARHVDVPLPEGQCELQQVNTPADLERAANHGVGKGSVT